MEKSYLLRIYIKRTDTSILSDAEIIAEVKDDESNCKLLSTETSDYTKIYEFVVKAETQEKAAHTAAEYLIHNHDVHLGMSCIPGYEFWKQYGDQHA